MATLANRLVGLGRTPALIVIDATIGFTSPLSPLGSEVSAELRAIAILLEAVRRKRLPVFFTTNSYSDPSEASVFRAKIPLLNELAAGSELARIDPRVAPQADEAVINKGLPSAFFDTPLRQRLIDLGVDSLLVVGFSTSGCVRATAVDALQCNLRVVVVGEACGDRDRAAHDANLRDIGLKYGDVVSLDQALGMIDSLPNCD